MPSVTWAKPLDKDYFCKVMSDLLSDQHGCEITFTLTPKTAGEKERCNQDRDRG